jgi:uncharacterized protein
LIDSSIVLVITIIGMVVGFIGVFLPILPGLGLIYLSILFYSFMTGFVTISIGTNVILAIVTLIAMVLGYLNSILLLKKLGLSKQSVNLAAGGSIVGLFFAKARGMIIGQLIGAIAGEVMDSKSVKRGLRAGGISLLAFIVAMLIDVIFAIFLIGTFIFNITR